MAKILCVPAISDIDDVVGYVNARGVYLKSEAIQSDIASISELEKVVARISELEAMIGKRKADLIAESNARYHSQK